MSPSPNPDRITVLHLCEHFGNAQVSYHGVARLFELWIPAFDPARFRMLLCSRQAGAEAADRRLRAAGIQPLYLGYGKLDPRNLLKLIRLVRAEKVDILHAHGYGACLWARLAGHLLRRPVIVHEHCNYGTVPWFQRPVEAALGPFTRLAYAVSESTRQFTIEKRHIPAPAVKLLYSGIPLDKVSLITPERILGLRTSQGATPSTLVLGVVGRLESHKGHIDAFRALQQILAARPDTQLWIVGDGRYQDALLAWVRDHDMAGPIRFLGYRSDVLDVIQAFDIQLFPSHQEGTPSTLFEAMAVGNAIVASTADGQAEVLEPERTALLFTPGEADAMARHVLRLMNDEPLRQRLRQAAREKIKDYDMSKCLAEMASAYERLASDRKGRA